jgi:transketolase
VTHDELRSLAQRCTDTRLRVLEQVEVAGGGHYGSSLSLVELVVSLFHTSLRVRPDDPEWAGHDRFILSKGHGCSTLYAVLADLGFFDLDVLGTFTRLGSILGDHPDRRKVPGVDFSSGSLGHGLSVGVGMALGLRHQGQHDSRVCVLIGDGEQNEGQMWEGAAAASWKQLGNLLVVCDRNNVQVDGTTGETLDMEPIADKWRAFGWDVIEVDGHDLSELTETWERLDARRSSTGTPTFVLAHTVAGKGIPAIEGDAAWHVGYLHGPDVDAAVETIRAVHADLLEEVPS